MAPIKGTKLSEEHKTKISEALKGKIPKNIELLKTKAHKFEKGQAPWNKGVRTGYVPSSAWKKGHKPWNYIDGKSGMKYCNGWKKICRQVYVRDNYVCQKCYEGMEDSKCAHHVHHIIPFRESKDNGFNNLITLCPSCHSKTHNKMLKEGLNHVNF